MVVASPVSVTVFVMVTLAFRVATHPEEVEWDPEDSGDAVAPSETLA